MSERIDARQLAELYLARRMSFAEFMDAAPSDAEDEEVAELIDLIGHEPKCRGLPGASPRSTIGTWNEFESFASISTR